MNDRSQSGPHGRSHDRSQSGKAFIHKMSTLYTTEQRFPINWVRVITVRCTYLLMIVGAQDQRKVDEAFDTGSDTLGMMLHYLHVEYHMAMGSNQVQYHVGSEPHVTSPSIPRSMATNQVDDILEMGIVSVRVLDGTRGSLSEIFV